MLCNISLLLCNRRVCLLGGVVVGIWFDTYIHINGATNIADY